MIAIIVIVFLAVFLIAALLLMAGGSEKSQQTQRIVSRLQSIVTAAPVIPQDDLDLRKPQHLSSIPWLDHLLARVDVFPRLSLLLYQADLKWTPGTLLLYVVGCGGGAALAVYWRTGSPWLALGLGALAGWIPFYYVFRRRKKRFAAFEQLLPDALALIVGALRAGHSLTSAIGMAGREMAQPLSGEFRKCFDEQMFGIETRTAMMNLVTRVPIQPVRIIATAVLIQKESGGNLAEVLEKGVYVIRERFKLRRQVSVHTAQGRLSGWILAVLPVVLGFALYFVNPQHFSLLWRNPLGLRMLYGAAIMSVIGTLVIRKIVNIRI